MRVNLNILALAAMLILFLFSGLGQPLLAQEEEPKKKEAPTSGAETPTPAPDPGQKQDNEQDDKGAKGEKDDGDVYYPFHTDDKGLPLEKFINWASHALGMPFFWTSQAKQQSQGPQKVVIVTEEMRIPREALLDFVRTALRVHKLALVPVGPKGAEFILIEHLDQPTIIQTRRVFVPASEIEKYKDSYIPIVTTVHVEHVNVQQIQTQIQRLNPTATAYGAAIIPAPSENAFIIVDFGPEVYNLVRLIKEMDKEGVKFDQTLEIIELEFADSGEMESILSEILQEDGSGSPGQPGIPQPFPGGAKQPPAPKIIPDERANRLVVWAVPDDHRKIRDLVKQLDTDVPASTGRVTVYNLKNSVAEDLVETLKEIMEGSSGTSRRSGGGPGQGSLQTTSGGDKVDIVADAGANAVLIRGTKTRVQEVIEIIKQLDIRKPQVLVEAAILELQHDNSVDLGVELGAFDAKDDLTNTFRPFAYTNLGLSTIQVSEDGIFRVPNVGNQGVIGGIFDGDGFLFPVLIRAFQQKGYTNLLSMPSVLTNDNQEATIRVARSIPYTQLNQGAPGQVSTQTFGDYAEAPIELSISPHISSNDYLRLDIRFLVEVFGVPSLASPGIPPPKTAREITTAVTVPNGATVVIGGLTLDDQTEVISQIPILGDIPIIGFLFRSKSTRQQKNTLFLFLTPRILTDPQFRDLDEISTQKKAEIAALQGQVDLVDPEFGRRFQMLDPAKSIQDVERTGVFDRPYIHSPVDEEDETEAAQKNGVTRRSAQPRMKAPTSGKTPKAGSGDVVIEPAPDKTSKPPADG